MVKACAERDRHQVIERSTSLGFLTGGWPKRPFCWRLAGPSQPHSLAAASGNVAAQRLLSHTLPHICHVPRCRTNSPLLFPPLRVAGDESAVMLDAHVEAGMMVGIPFGTPGLYDFGSHGGMTKRVSELGAVMLKHRLTPVSGGGREQAWLLH